MNRPQRKALFLDLSDWKPSDTETGLYLLNSTIERVEKNFADTAMYYAGILPEQAVVSDRWKSVDDLSNGNATGAGDRETSAGPGVEQIVGILAENLSDPVDYLLYMKGLYPLLDPLLVQEMEALQVSYLAHCTVAENVPPGIAPPLVSREFAESLRDKNVADIQEFALANLNDYDVEIHFALPDIRRYRLDFSGHDERSAMIARALLEKKADAAYVDIHALIEDDPTLLRPFPAVLEVELTTESEVRFAHTLPVPESRVMDKNSMGALLQDINTQGPDNSLTVIVGGAGDPLLHPEAEFFLEGLLRSRKVRQIYLETYATTLPQSIVDWLSGQAQKEGFQKLAIIVRLTTLRPERYKELYGKDMFSRVRSHIDTLSAETSTGERASVYVEMLRINDVEDEIEEFFDTFEKTAVTPIAGKFNSYAGRLAERRVSDLTPLVRDPCCHLERDLYVLANGKIPVCKQDPHAEGQFVQRTATGQPGQSLAEVARALDPFYVASWQEKLEQVPAPCGSCDEWFTYNA